jgi:hypothetical protein
LDKSMSFVTVENEANLYSTVYFPTGSVRE